MKKIVISFLMIGSLLLVGCNKKDNTKDQGSAISESDTTALSSSVASSSSTASSSTSSSQVAETVALWNAEKATKLNQFVMEWGKTLQQTYQEYTPDKNVDLYGLELPQAVLTVQSGWQAAVNDAPIKLTWSKDGEGQDYALVAVFSDAETSDYLEKHVYFFTLVAGEPKVLVTSQNQGNEQNYLHVKETDNQELKNGFAKIVSGQ